MRAKHSTQEFWIWNATFLFCITFTLLVIVPFSKGVQRSVYSNRSIPDRFIDNVNNNRFGVIIEIMRENQFNIWF